MKHLILHELKHHAPFTAFGALSGILILVALAGIPHEAAERTFYVLHPLHVLLSAIVTASMYKNYKCAQDKKGCNIFSLLVVGVVGSVGIATLSDSIIPFAGEVLLRLPHAEPHMGFIEEWWLIFPMAILGIAIAYFKPSTKFPHAGHVLLSTWASLFHIIMAMGKGMSPLLYVPLYLFLFVSVWLPCCVSDIVFPLLFVGGKKQNCSFCGKD